MSILNDILRPQKDKVKRPRFSSNLGDGQQNTSENGKASNPWLRWLLNLLFLFAWGVTLGFISLYYGKANYGMEIMDSYLHNPALLCLNLLPAVLLTFWVFLLFNRVWPAVLCSGGVVFFLALANYFKILFRGDPLAAADIAYISEAYGMGKRYHISLSADMICFIVVIIVLSVLAFFFLKAKMHSTRLRIVLFLLSSIVCAGLLPGVYFNDDVYISTENLDVEFADEHLLSQWNETDQYVSRGFLYPLLYSVGNIEHKPYNYSSSLATDILSRYPNENIPEEKKVNIVAIMLEAYCDFSIYDEFREIGLGEGEYDPYSFLHELQQESISGTLVTNVFAGGTINTETAVLTGSTSYYTYRKEADSVAWYLDSQGYFTQYCHPGHNWFYNRKNVTEYLGFQNSYFFENRYEVEEDWLMQDVDFFQDLAVLYDENTGNGTPYFNFCVSYQNHGPYTSDDYDNYWLTCIPEGDLTEESYYILSNYFGGIYRTDQSLRTLVESFRASDEPVVFMFFGDHKPWLGDNDSVYEELGFDLSRHGEKSFYNYYTTPYVIWANDAAKTALGNDFTGKGDTISPCFLMTKLFDLCGYTGDSMMQAQRKLLDEGVDVVHTTGRYVYDGNVVVGIRPDAEKRLNEVQVLQYYRKDNVINYKDETETQ